MVVGLLNTFKFQAGEDSIEKLVLSIKTASLILQH